MADLKCPACGEKLMAPLSEAHPIRRTKDGHAFIVGVHQRCGTRIRAFLGQDPVWEVDRSPVGYKPLDITADEPAQRPINDDPLRAQNEHLARMQSDQGVRWF